MQDEDEEKDDKDDEISQVASTDDKTESETDIQYWQRILGPAYNEHMIQTLKEQEELANRLGKGKRVRKHINYAEKEMMDAAEALSKVSISSCSWWLGLLDRQMRRWFANLCRIAMRHKMTWFHGISLLCVSRPLKWLMFLSRLESVWWWRKIWLFSQIMNLHRRPMKVEK